MSQCRVLRSCRMSKKEIILSIVSLICCLSVWLMYIPAFQIHLFVIWFFQLFIVLIPHHFAKSKRIYDISVILLFGSNLLNTLIMLFNYLHISQVLQQPQYKNAIASEQFSAAVLIMVGPIIMKVFTIISAVVTAVVLVECVISKIRREKRKNHLT